MALVVLLVVALPLGAAGWTPLPVAEDPLLRMPGSQPGTVTLEASTRCLNCHDGYNTTVDPGRHWKGSMMAQSMRDPLFWAAMTVAAQDSVFAIGRPNATDLCLRCHTPPGWLGGRSDPTNASAMTADDFDGVTCDSCHRMLDPFFEDTHAGLRDGSDWTGYWDETGASATPASTAADATLAADRTESAAFSFFNGDPFYDAMYQPAPASYLEPGAGQFFMAAPSDKRASFADLNPPHNALYSRFHRSRYFCGTCHDVSNPALQNLAFEATAPGDGTTILPSEQTSAHGYFHVERTFSEFMLSDYALGDGAAGSGYYAPSRFSTSRPGNQIASCQDCHMPDRVGPGCDKNSALIRPDESVEHPKSGQPLHDLTGGNLWIPWILASTIPTSPNYDATNAALLAGRQAELTMDLAAGIGLDAAALLDGSNRARLNLQRAASIDALSYTKATGALSFRIINHTGHKLPTGFPEGRRMFVNIRVWKAGAIVAEINPYDASAATLRGLDAAYSPSSPALGAGESVDESLVYEVALSSSITAESHSFHFVLADGRQKDNRIPPPGFRVEEAAARLSEPVWEGSSAPSYFTAAEYAGGYDDVSVTVPTDADVVEVRLYYQTTSREYVEFLRDQINGDATTLPPADYIAGADPFFDGLRAWGTTIWDLFWHNRDLPGAAPVEMLFASIGDPCEQSGSDGAPCSDGDACTTVDTCAGGVCVGGGDVACAGAAGCLQAGVCNSATGECEYAAVPDATACDDGDACTTVDSCTVGSCTGGSPLVCDPPGVCEELGVCDAATGICAYATSIDGTTCAGGQCDVGVCVPLGSSDAGVQSGDAGQTIADAGIALDAGSSSGDGSISGHADGGLSSMPPDGCGCRLVSEDRGASGLPRSLLLLGLGLLVARRRFRKSKLR